VDALLHGWFGSHDDLDGKRLFEALVIAWMMTDVPTAHLSEDVWVYFLSKYRHLAGPTMALPRSKGKLKVYRGAFPEHSNGLSWTTNRDVAVWFSRRMSAIRDGAKVYTTTVSRDDVVADLRRTNPGESEILINPNDLKIREVPLSDTAIRSSLDRWLLRAERLGKKFPEYDGTPTVSPPPKPDEGWKPLEQSIYPDGEGYVPFTPTPDSALWPRPDDVTFTQVGDQLLVCVPHYERY
jgi:hypothetical protein